MATILQQLVGLHRAEFARAASLQRMIVGAQVAITLSAVLSVLVSDSRIAYVLAVLSLIASLAWAFLGVRCRASRALAERGRRLTYLVDGLGAKISEAELLRIRAAFSVSDAEADGLADPDYYFVSEDAGPARIAGMVEESAFWSADLLRQSARFTLLWLLFAAGCLFAVLLSIPLVDAGAGLVSARLVCAAFILPLSNDFVGAFFAYRAAASDVDAVLIRIQRARETGFEAADVLVIVGDYNSAVESAPMFVRGAYNRRKCHLNKRWHEYQAALQRRH